VHEGESNASFVEVLRDDEYPASGLGRRTASARDNNHVPKHPQAGSLPVPVVHIQSPWPDTFIFTNAPLGVTLPFLGVQIKPLGEHRGLRIEVEVVDSAGRRGVVRLCSRKVCQYTRL
jgi:hypothetical protein